MAENLVRVRILEGTNAGGRPVEPKEELTIPKAEAAMLVHLGRAVVLDAPNTGGGGGVDEKNADPDAKPGSVTVAGARRRAGRPRNDV